MIFSTSLQPPSPSLLRLGSDLRTPLKYTTRFRLMKKDEISLLLVFTGERKAGRNAAVRLYAAAEAHVRKESLMDLVARVSKHVCRRNGVITDMKSFGTVQLGYGIKKLDGRYYQGHLMQMTMILHPTSTRSCTT
ncbi:hypothetical protein ACFXTO_026270 [Malus domestica]